MVLIVTLYSYEYLSRMAITDTVLDFEGVGNNVAIGGFYAGQLIFFSPNGLGLIDSDAGGSGNFGGEPSPSTGMYYTSGQSVIMDVLIGFTSGISVWYSAVNNPGVITVYDAAGATGNVLAVLNLPITPNGGAPDPNGSFSPFVRLEVPFAGVALSVEFGGSPNQIVFDNVQLGLHSTGVPPGYFD